MPLFPDVNPTAAWLAAALALGLLVQLALPVQAPAPVAFHAHRTVASPQAPSPDPVPDYPVILQRPLFAPSRAGGAQGATPEAAPVGVFALLGVASAGARASAILQEPGGTARTLGLGDALEGWRVERIGGDRAVLRRGATTQVLTVGAPPARPLAPTTVGVGAPLPPAAVPGGPR